MFFDTRLVLPVVDGETFVLARDPATIGVKEILDCIRNSGKKIRLRTDVSEEESEINALLIGVEDATTKALAGKSLQEMILRLTPPEARE